VPVTPFHFGPGTLAKGLLPRRVSLTAFIVSQIAIDVESGYHLFRGEWPVHREVHSLLVAALVGVLSGAFVWSMGRVLPNSGTPRLRGELAALPAYVGGLLGGLSHVFLDGIMHPDLHPFWPFSTANPFLGLVSLGTLHLFCIVCGAVGVLLLGFRA
jgi:membrane-bound metal-dependent hydrolase YbcI (DUF457 family)